MINKDTAIPIIMQKLRSLPEGHAIDLRTYKRNRSVVISRTGDDCFDVAEKGFHEERFSVALSGMKRLLKTLLKREFPRSTKIRVYTLDRAGADAPVQRKKI